MIKKILIIDDDKSLVEIWTKWLKENGYDVITINESVNCYPVVEIEQPDLILLDVLMPGDDGLQVARKLKTNPCSSHIPIIMMSAIYKDFQIRASNKGVLDDFLEKPFEKEELLGKVRKLSENNGIL